MIEMFLLALLFAVIRRYRLAPLFKEWATYLILVYAVIYMFLNIMVFSGNVTLVKYSWVLKVIYISIFVILILKYNLYKAGFLGVAFIVLGGIMNNIVIKANGGKMPIFPTLSYLTGYINADMIEKMPKYDSIHIMGDSSTKLPFLADYIDLGYTLLSPGDVFIIFIMFLLTYEMIKHLNNSIQLKTAPNKN